MQPELDLILWSVLLSSAIVLGVRWLVIRRPLPKFEERESTFTGHGFDPEPMRKRVEEVRRDFTDAARDAHRMTVAHEQLLAAAREMISQMDYFRRRRELPR